MLLRARPPWPEFDGSTVTSRTAGVASTNGRITPLAARSGRDELVDTHRRYVAGVPRVEDLRVRARDAHVDVRVERGEVGHRRGGDAAGELVRERVVHPGAHSRIVGAGVGHLAAVGGRHEHDTDERLV